MKVQISDHVIFQTLNDEAVLLNLTTQEYYGLDDVGAQMWKLLIESGDLDGVLQRLKAIYAADEAVLRQDLRLLVDKLLNLNLLTVATD